MNLFQSHPKALPFLFFVEMWERFSYYGMRGLLVLYATKQLLFSDKEAGSLYGYYTALVYFTPVTGGYISDHYLGWKKSIILGSVTMALGHASLALSGLNFFYIGLGFLVVGNGFFKPNMSNLVGLLYGDDTTKKDSGFTIFYMGINLGAFLGSLACGYLGETQGWEYGFGLAGIGMVLGLILFLITDSLKILPNRKNFLDATPSKDNSKTQNRFSTSESSESQNVKQTNTSWKKEYNHLLGILCFLMIFNIVFWLGFEQVGSSINLFTDRYLDRKIFDFTIPASMFQSINPFLIMFLSIPFSIFLEKRNLTGMGKFSLGLSLLGLGFFFISFSAIGIETSTAQISPIWLVLAIFLHTIGELCVSPIGLSKVHSLAPIGYGGIFLGIWFFSNAIAHYAAGYFSGFMSETSISIFFGSFGVLALSFGLIAFFFRNRIKI